MSDVKLTFDGRDITPPLIDFGPGFAMSSLSMVCEFNPPNLIPYEGQVITITMPFVRAIWNVYKRLRRSGDLHDLLLRGPGKEPTITIPAKVVKLEGSRLCGTPYMNVTFQT